MKRVYLAGPIFGKNDDECKDWRLKVWRSLPLGWTAIDPMARDYRGKESIRNAVEIVTQDKHDIRKCDAVIANVREPSVGTSMEILFAFQLAIPVITIVGDDGRLSPWILAHAYSRFCTEESAARELESLA